jgi:hypothetical protein
MMNRIVNKYSPTAQAMFRKVVEAKFRHLKHPSDVELRNKYLSIDGLMEEQFLKEEANDPQKAGTAWNSTSKLSH